MEPIYQRLAAHLNKLSMGYPGSQELPDLLQAMFTPDNSQGAGQDRLPSQPGRMHRLRRVRRDMPGECGGHG